MPDKREKTLSLIRDNYPFLSGEFGVDKIGIFGSVAKGTADLNSDVDLFVTLQKPLGYKFVELVAFLETVLNSRVDVLTEEGVNSIRNKNISNEIRENIIYVKEK